MSKRFTEFIFSFGIMVAGVGLLFFGSVTYTAAPVKMLVDKLPVSAARAQMSQPEIVKPAALPASRPAVPEPVDDVSFSGALSAAAVVVVDDKSNTVLYKKNFRDGRPLASITKLMTALVLQDVPLKWNTVVEVTDEDIDPSSHHLQVGEKLTLEQLWQVALIGSSNSAVKALVRASGFTEEEFVARMNKKARDLHLPSLQFAEPTGLSARNTGTVFDISRLLQAALADPRILGTLSVQQYELKQGRKVRTVWSTNWLLTHWVPSTFSAKEIVGKTGYIQDSGYNFAVRLSDGEGLAVRVVVLGSASNEARFTEARDLAYWVFDHFVWPDEADYARIANVNK